MRDFFLFETRESVLKNFIEDLSDNDIYELTYNRIYQRGEAYYHEGMVESVWYSGRKNLEAVVVGHDKYNVLISLENQSVTASCSCPYGGICKHIIAILLFATFEEVDLRSPSIEIYNDNLRDWLKTLSKNELIDLVDRFATKDFRTKIQNQFLPEDQSIQLIERVNKKIDRLFEDDDLLWEPGDMEAALEKQISKLEGISEEHGELILSILIKIIDKVDDAQDQGYLYNSYHDDVFDGDFLSAFTHNFIKSILTQKKVDYLNQLEKKLKQTSYCSFDGMLKNIHQLFIEEELTILKDIVLQNIQNEDYSNFTSYFEIIKSIIDEDEKSLILGKTYHLNSTMALQAAEHLENQGNLDAAIEALESHRKKDMYWNGMEKVLTELLRLKKKNETIHVSFAEDVLSDLPFGRILRLVTGYLPDKKKSFENILLEKSPMEFLDYLERDKRLEEALALVQRKGVIWEERKYTFFRKYKKSFPDQARDYFIKRINENLLSTGDEFYHNIADTLNSLKIIDSDKATEIREMIKINYKRRRNLMKLIS